MNHDPLCLLPQVDYPCKQCWEIDCECTCICDIIDKVRKDAGSAGPIIGSLSIAALGEANRSAYEQGQRDMLAKCIETVTVDLIDRGLDAYDDEFFERSCQHEGGTDSICYECNKERVVAEIHFTLRALQEKS